MKIQIESMSIKYEIQNLLDLHYEELTEFKDVVRLDPDYGKYYQLEEAGLLKVVTVRVESKLIGYCTLIISPTLHYRSSSEALVDLFYVGKDHRKGLVGLKLLRYVEKVARDYGAVTMRFPFKVEHPLTPLVKRCRFKNTETVWSKLL